MMRVAKVFTVLLEPLIRAVVVLVIGFIALHVFVLSPPYTFLSAEVITPVVVAGEPVILAYVRDKKKNCDDRINQFIVNNITREVVWSANTAGIAGPIGITLSTIKLSTSPEWVAGDYVYQQVVHQRCGLFTFSTPTPHVRFTLIDDGDK